MLTRWNKLAYSSFHRTTNIYVNRTIKKHAYLCWKPRAGQSRCYHHKCSKTCNLQRTKSFSSVYRTVLSSQPSENHRQFSVMVAPRHTHLDSRDSRLLIREMDIPRWRRTGVDLCLGSSRGMFTELGSKSNFLLEKCIDSWPVELARSFFIGIHDNLGIPWWVTIIAGTICFRLAILPLNIMSLRSQGKLVAVQPEINTKTQDIISNLSAAAVLYRAKPLTMKRETRLQIKQMRREIYETHNCAPLKPLAVAYVTIPIVLSCGFGLRSCSGRFGTVAVEKYFQPDLAIEGTLWFTNLTVPDPYYILPTLVTISVISGLEYAILHRKVNHQQLNWGVSVVPESRLQKMVNYLSRFFQAVSLCCYPILCWYAPTSVTLYLLIMSSWSLTQLLTFSTPSVKKALSIPMTTVCSPTPHRDVLNAFKTNYLLRKKKTQKSKSQPE